MPRCCRRCLCCVEWCFGSARKKIEVLGGYTQAVEKNAVCRFASEKLQALENLQILQSLDRLERLESLQRLGSLDLKTYNEDYRKVPIPDGSIVYCDPPYKGTHQYLCDFDSDAFYHWALTRDYPIFISEYAMPDKFAPIAIKQMTCTMSPTAHYIVAEKIFVQRRYADKYKRDLFL